jgi:hypothetical protein
VTLTGLEHTPKTPAKQENPAGRAAKLMHLGPEAGDVMALARQLAALPQSVRQALAAVLDGRADNGVK